MERICAITQRYGLPGRFITLEILEGSALENLEKVSVCVERLHISTVAEGIETEDHASLMREMRCDYGQGYYYSRPISVTEFTNRYLRAVDSKSR